MVRRRKWKFCPICTNGLVEKAHEDQMYLACSAPGCEFFDWNNPVPVVASLIVGDGGIVLVKRGVEPFIGRWCLPRGFLKTDENPKAAVVRETLEESGLKIRLLRMLNACNPSPANFPLNQLTLFYLATAYGGALAPGSDATEAGVFAPDALPDICFGSDTQIIADWFAGVHGTLDQPVNYRLPGKVTEDSIESAGSSSAKN